MARKRKESDAELRLTAYHEVSHGVVGWVSLGFRNVSRISIRGTNGDRGEVDWTYSLRPKRRRDIIGRVAAYLAGPVSEVIFGRSHIWGNCNDYKNATEIAREMVFEEGMGRRVGQIYLRPNEVLSEHLRRKIENDIRDILAEGRKLARRLIRRHRREIETLVEILLKRKVISSKVLKEVLGPKA